jgi:hypothetical protein
MNIIGLCTASAVGGGGGAISPTEEEKLNFCFIEMNRCPRAQQFLEFVATVNMFLTSIQT